MMLIIVAESRAGQQCVLGAARRRKCISPIGDKSARGVLGAISGLRLKQNARAQLSAQSVGRAGGLALVSMHDQPSERRVCIF
jgi:hypothetical protein